MPVWRASRHSDAPVRDDVSSAPWSRGLWPHCVRIALPRGASDRPRGPLDELDLGPRRAPPGASAGAASVPARHSHPTTWLKLSRAPELRSGSNMRVLSERSRRSCVRHRTARSPTRRQRPRLRRWVPGSAALAPDSSRLRPGYNGAPGRRRGYLMPQFVGIPDAGGAGCVPVYGVMAEPATGVVVSGPPERTIWPFLIMPISAPEKPP